MNAQHFCSKGVSGITSPLKTESPGPHTAILNITRKNYDFIFIVIVNKSCFLKFNAKTIKSYQVLE